MSLVIQDYESLGKEGTGRGGRERNRSRGTGGERRMARERKEFGRGRNEKGIIYIVRRGNEGPGERRKREE